MSALADFKTAFKEAGGLVQGAVAAGGILPVASLFTGFGPPWPGKATVLLAIIAELLAAALVFDRYRSRRGAKRALKVAGVLVVVTLIAYAVIHSALTFVMPGGDREVQGFVVRQDVAPLITGDYDTNDALRDSSWHPEDVWEVWSITVVRLSLLLFWLAFFASVASFLILFVIRSAARKTAG